MFNSACVLLALASSSFASVFLTSPTASSTFTGGQQATISWIDDGKQPSLQAFGSASIGIFTGNAIQQTMLQQVVASVNVATTGTVQFTPDPSIGPNGNEYFVRVQSLTATDPTNPQYPAEAFSAKFTMAGMSGTFNSTVQAQIDGQSTAPIGGPTASGASGASSTPAAASGTASKAPAASASGSATASAAKSTASNGASSLAVSGIGALVGVVAIFGITF
jgi:hypothetical protein